MASCLLWHCMPHPSSHHWEGPKRGNAAALHALLGIFPATCRIEPTAKIRTIPTAHCTTLHLPFATPTMHHPCSCRATFHLTCAPPLRGHTNYPKFTALPRTCKDARLRWLVAPSAGKTITVSDCCCRTALRAQGADYATHGHLPLCQPGTRTGELPTLPLKRLHWHTTPPRPTSFFRLPRLRHGLHSATMARWRLRPGTHPAAGCTHPHARLPTAWRTSPARSTLPTTGRLHSTPMHLSLPTRTHLPPSCTTLLPPHGLQDGKERDHATKQAVVLSRHGRTGHHAPLLQHAHCWTHSTLAAERSAPHCKTYLPDSKPSRISLRCGSALRAAGDRHLARAYHHTYLRDKRLGLRRGRPPPRAFILTSLPYL